jgi:hypothetical protein
MIIEFVFEEFMANPTYVFANKIPGIAAVEISHQPYLSGCSFFVAMNVRFLSILHFLELILQLHPLEVLHLAAPRYLQNLFLVVLH